MISLTVASSFRAAATRRLRANFEAFAGPAALWIAVRSSAVRRNANTQRRFCPSKWEGYSIWILHLVNRACNMSPSDPKTHCPLLPGGAARGHSGRLRGTKWAFHGQFSGRFFASGASAGEGLFPLRSRNQRLTESTGVVVERHPLPKPPNRCPFSGGFARGDAPKTPCPREAMPLFGPWRGSEGTFLIPRWASRTGSVEPGAGPRGDRASDRACGPLRRTVGRTTRHPFGYPGCPSGRDPAGGLDDPPGQEGQEHPQLEQAPPPGHRAAVLPLPAALPRGEASNFLLSFLPSSCTAAVSRAALTLWFLSFTLYEEEKERKHDNPIGNCCLPHPMEIKDPVYQDSTPHSGDTEQDHADQFSSSHGYRGLLPKFAPFAAATAGNRDHRDDGPPGRCCQTARSLQA